MVEPDQRGDNYRNCTEVSNGDPVEVEGEQRKHPTGAKSAYRKAEGHDGEAEKPHTDLPFLTCLNEEVSCARGRVRVGRSW